MRGLKGVRNGRRVTHKTDKYEISDGNEQNAKFGWIWGTQRERDNIWGVEGTQKRNDVSIVTTWRHALCTFSLDIVGESTQNARMTHLH